MFLFAGAIAGCMLSVSGKGRIGVSIPIYNPIGRNLQVIARQTAYDPVKMVDDYRV